MAVSNFFIYFFYFAGVVEGQKPTKSFRPRLWDTILIFYSTSPLTMIHNPILHSLNWETFRVLQPKSEFKYVFLNYSVNEFKE